MTSCRALLLRHGQTVWNAEHRWQGLADAELSALGEEQSLTAARLLRDAGITAIVSSPLGRARRTAAVIANVLGLDESAIAIEEDLRERDVGEWSGLTSEEIEQRWPGMLDQWRSGRLDSLPGGEGDITARVMPALERIVRRRPGDVLLVVTHGGVITAIERALGVEPCRARNCSGRWVRWDARAAVLAAEEAVVLADPGQAAETTSL